MANKQIKSFSEIVSPVDNDELLLQQSSGGATRKSKLINLLKRTFGFDDVFDSHTISSFGFAASGGNTQPTLKDFRNGMYLWAFDSGAQIQEGMFSINVNHTIKQGTDLNFTVHWSHNQSSPSGDVKWNIDYTIARGESAGVFSAPTTVSAVQTAGPQYTHQTTTDMTISGSDIEIEPSSIIICRIWRDFTGDAFDTFNADAFFINVELHYTKSRVGTLEKNRPFTSGGFS